jgi:hypothetical protein
VPTSNFFWYAGGHNMCLLGCAGNIKGWCFLRESTEDQSHKIQQAWLCRNLWGTYRHVTSRRRGSASDIRYFREEIALMVFENDGVLVTSDDWGDEKLVQLRRYSKRHFWIFPQVDKYKDYFLMLPQLLTLFLSTWINYKPLWEMTITKVRSNGFMYWTFILM